MAFFSSTVSIIQSFIAAFGIGMGILGGITYFEGQSQDNPAAKSQGFKQIIGGCGIAMIGTVVVPLLSSMF